jgi:hypothetical protein
MAKDARMAFLFAAALLASAPARGDFDASGELRPLAPFKKVFLIVLENEDASNALDQPYLADLASRGALLSDFHAEVHPSQGNYLALTSGSFHGMEFLWGDWTVTVHARNIADLLEEKGLTWKSYAEDYPGGCFKGDSGKYRRKHNPFISYRDIQKEPDRCARIVNSSELDTDIANGTLPDYSFYVPNLDNDGHDTHVAVASKWLQTAFDQRLSDPRFMSDMLFIVTFDESQTLTPHNPIYTVFYGPGVTPGAVSDSRYDHYSILRTIEDTFGLGTLTERRQGLLYKRHLALECVGADPLFDDHRVSDRSVWLSLKSSSQSSSPAAFTRRGT